MNPTSTRIGKAIRLSKVSDDGWIVSNDTRFSVRRYHWELPYKSISYRLFKDGVHEKGSDFDTLADLKDYLVDFGKIPSLFGKTQTSKSSNERS